MEKTVCNIDASKVEQINAIDFVSPVVLNNPRISKVPKKIDSIFFNSNNEKFVVLSNYTLFFIILFI